MRQEFNAIFENGVLRPLQPVDLREHEVVAVSVSPAGDVVALQKTVAKQREVLSNFADEMARLADAQPVDDFTNRDHDRVLYGNPD